jgi:hypothetical protein
MERAPVDKTIKNKFSELWKKFFNNAELPITFYYSDNASPGDVVKAGTLPRCIIGAIGEGRKGRSLTFDTNSVGCFGGRKYLGFAQKLRPEFKYFLSCGIPGKIEGERYKKSPGLVQDLMKKWPEIKAPRPFVVFKKWDNLEEEDSPEVVIFFARPDVLAGLYTLANFDQPDPQGVIVPMGSGCSSIVSYPYQEKDSPNPRAVIGLFDPSARPYVPDDVLSFSVPIKKFFSMVDNMEESFLITDTWKTLQKRI